MMDFSKILEHPDKEEVISKLIAGISPKDIAEWLELKYSTKEQYPLRLSQKLLKSFIDSNLDLYKQIKEDVKLVKEGKAPNKVLSKSLINNKTYQERINSYIDQEVDIKKLMRDLIFLIRDRFEQVFDRIQEDPSNIRQDHNLIRYFETLSNYIDRYDKIINGSPDQVIQHNITVQRVEEHTFALQEAIREVMTEIEPEMAFIFMEKLNAKLVKLKPEKIELLSQEKRFKEAQILSQKAHIEEEE